MCLFCKYFFLLMIVLLLSSCQGDQEKTTATPSVSKGEAETTRPMKKKGTAPLGVRVKEEVKVVEKAVKKNVTDTKEKVEEAAANVDLKVSGDYLEKIDEENKNYLTAPPKLDEAASGSSRKIEVSGGVFLDGKEKDLTKKLDGGKVEISIPLN